jgi:hypothetical protein
MPDAGGAIPDDLGDQQTVRVRCRELQPARSLGRNTICPGSPRYTVSNALNGDSWTASRSATPEIRSPSADPIHRKAQRTGRMLGRVRRCPHRGVENRISSG